MKKITFVLPTKNRPIQLKNFFNYHSRILKKIPHNFLVVDASNQKNYYENSKNLKKYKNIKIIRQYTKGIQKGCIEAIPYIKTEYSTFLYDDDYLGKYITEIYKSNMKDKNTFSLGCGIIEKYSKKIEFKKLKFSNVDKQQILLAYYGKKISLLEKNILPVSPICTSFETNFLKKWKNVLNKFVKNNSFRKLLFFEKDIGPDMLVYLMLINQSKKSVKLFTPYSVKFSSHSESISIIYGNSFLRIGYWLARICYFQIDRSLKDEKSNEAYTYLIMIGFFLMITNLFKFYYLKNILIEIYNLYKFKNKFLISYFIKYIFKYLI